MRQTLSTWLRLSHVTLGIVSGLVLLAACGSNAPRSAASLLVEARRVVAATNSVHFVLSGDGGGSGGGLSVTGGSGDVARPGQLRGEFTVDDGGITASVAVLSTRNFFLVKLPFQSSYSKTTPATLGVSNPATLLDPRQGLPALLGHLGSVRSSGQIRIGSEVVDQISGSVPGAVVTLPPDNDPHLPVAVTLGITNDSHQVRTLALTGPFGSHGHIETYHLALSNYGEAVTVTLPGG